MEFCEECGELLEECTCDVCTVCGGNRAYCDCEEWDNIDLFDELDEDLFDNE